MTRIEAYISFAHRPPAGRAVLPFDVRVGKWDYWPAFATAIVSLSGFLEDSKTDAELDEGIEHYQALSSIGIRDQAQLLDEARDVLNEVMDYCRDRYAKAGFTPDVIRELYSS